MALLQEYIVCLWLIPVVFQICLPLVMLGGWFVIKLLKAILLRKSITPNALQSLPLQLQ